MPLRYRYGNSCSHESSAPARFNRDFFIRNEVAARVSLVGVAGRYRPRIQLLHENLHWAKDTALWNFGKGRMRVTSPRADLDGFGNDGS